MQANTDAITLDVRGLPPPEPLEQVLEALSTLGSAQQLRVLIDREPFPLYDMLAQNGFQHHTRNTEDYRYEVLIWHVS